MIVKQGDNVKEAVYEKRVVNIIKQRLVKIAVAKRGVNIPIHFQKLLICKHI